MNVLNWGKRIKMLYDSDGLICKCGNKINCRVISTGGLHREHFWFCVETKLDIEICNKDKLVKMLQTQIDNCDEKLKRINHRLLLLKEYAYSQDIKVIEEPDGYRLEEVEYCMKCSKEISEGSIGYTDDLCVKCEVSFTRCLKCNLIVSWDETDKSDTCYDCLAIGADNNE